ncbi:MAG: hypothetical protein JW776_14880 [Candidatus Lokiarchaeota archaeon]|nr:hypothetical protein [Candidatus Lokiarchaeota archaeon]
MKISKRSQVILFFTLVFVLFGSMIASYTQLPIQNPVNNDMINTSVISSDVHIEEIERHILVNRYGIISVQDNIALFNNGSTPINYVYYTINDNYLANFLRFFAETEHRATLSFQEMRNKLFNHKSFIVYLNDPLLPGSSQNVIATSYYSGLYTSFLNGSNQYVFFNFSVVPFTPYLVYSVNTVIEMPYRTFFEDYTGDPDESGTSLYYTRNTVLPFSEEIVSVEGRNNQFSTIQFTEIERKIYLNPWGNIRIIENHKLKNTGALYIYIWEYRLPKTAFNITMYDAIGTIDGGSLNTQTGLYSVNLQNRAGINPNATKVYTLEYSLPRDEFFSKSYRMSSLKLNLNLFNYNILTQEQHTYIYLYAGKSLESTTITPQSIQYDKNAMILYFHQSNVFLITDYFLMVEYKESGFHLIARALLFSGILIIIFSAYSILRTRNKSLSEDEEIIREEVLPESEMREFISNYEEITAVRIDIKNIDEDLARKKIAKKAYNKQLKVLESKLKSTQEDIKPYKKAILDARGPIAEIVKKLELREAELISNQDGIKLYDERYKKGKLPSKQAYRTLRKQMEDNAEKIQKQIDRLINQMKAYLI